MKFRNMKLITITIISFLLCLGFVGSAPAQDQPAAPQPVPAPPCEANEHFNDFDFWVGEWDAAWQDANGTPLASGLSKTFHVSKADGVVPNIEAWKIRQLPRTGGRAVLEVQFGESLDSALLRRVVTIIDSDGQIVPGRIELSAYESVWAFTPKAPWRVGLYKLQAETILEDLAGNSLGRRFEEAVGARLKPIPKMVQREFRVREN